MVSAAYHCSPCGDQSFPKGPKAVSLPRKRLRESPKETITGPRYSPPGVIWFSGAGRFCTHLMNISQAPSPRRGNSRAEHTWFPRPHPGEFSYHEGALPDRYRFGLALPGCIMIEAPAVRTDSCSEHCSLGATLALPGNPEHRPQPTHALASLWAHAPHDHWGMRVLGRHCNQ